MAMGHVQSDVLTYLARILFRSLFYVFREYV
ncbi:hypothetical protein PJE062_3445 [Pseudovibrio sp. JE062]|nr:hypothetical protein PJE062_3445 [Pseudovibrio sp. JE062]